MREFCLRVTRCIVFRASGNAEMIDRAQSPKIECYDVREDRPDAKPNPFKMGQPVRLRDGTAANGIVTAIFCNEVRIEWEGVSGDPQWYHQDFVSKETRAVGQGRAPQQSQAEKDIVDQACRLVALMDDNQRRRFIAHIQDTYK